MAELTFEDAVVRLEEIVNALEGGSLTLDESLRRFEEAVALSRHCSVQLDEAEKQIRLLTPEGEATGADHLPWVADTLGGADGDDPFETHA